MLYCQYVMIGNLLEVLDCNKSITYLTLYLSPPEPTVPVEGYLKGGRTDLSLRV